MTDVTKRDAAVEGMCPLTGARMRAPVPVFKLRPLLTSPWRRW